MLQRQLAISGNFQGGEFALLSVIWRVLIGIQIVNIQLVGVFLN